jgi:hypothetical protein
MNNVMGLSLLGTLFLSNIVHSAVTKNYRLTFRPRFELGAEQVKEETVALMPGLFARHLCDVEWMIVKEGSSFIEVRLTGISRKRLESWLFTLESQTKDSIDEIREL